MLTNVDKDKLFPILEAKLPFKFNLEAIGRKLSVSEQRKIIDSFAIFPFVPTVDLENPKVIFKILEVFDDNTIYFGRQIATNTISKDIDSFHTRFDLRKRPYLGPTSTDHELAFLMAN